ncbi:MAG: hypothetical protein EHM23_09800 [Acidobacteria bacterium]|nr:MAG: hypothetical protein EHM23_09800 [Acidobacteriota bacterium]
MNNWFEVDKEGLARLLERRGKHFAVLELLQNAWDQSVTQVNERLEPIDGRPRAWLQVEDDDPAGFKDLSHAFTLFADSNKKADPGKRGRFNLGEKLVLAICNQATITTTKGTIHFEDSERRASRSRRERGSLFEGIIRVTRAEVVEALSVVKMLAPPRAVQTTVNGEILVHHEPLTSFSETLPTEIAGRDGTLRPTQRKTEVKLYEKRDGEESHLFELGIPIVELDAGEPWHLDVQQKVPLTLDRSNVTPSFLRKLRIGLLNQAYSLLDQTTAKADWIQQASAEKDCSNEAITALLDLKYGPKRVVFDVSDSEANNRAAAEGHVVIYGGSLSSGQWEDVRKAGAACPAGQLFPTARPEFSPDGESCFVPISDWTPAMRVLAGYLKRVGEALIEKQLQVDFFARASGPNKSFGASYSPGRLTLNVASAGAGRYQDFNDADVEEVDALLIHELAHDWAANHLSDDYHHALCLLAARLKKLALENPEIFRIR